MKKQTRTAKKSSQSAAVSQPQTSAAPVRTSPDARATEQPGITTIALIRADGSEFCRVPLPEFYSTIFAGIERLGHLTPEHGRPIIEHLLTPARGAHVAQSRLNDTEFAIEDSRASVFAFSESCVALIHSLGAGNNGALEFNQDKLDLLASGLRSMASMLNDSLQIAGSHTRDALKELRACIPGQTT